jgi:drug/metabolite transporter (DMT)-like permease
MNTQAATAGLGLLAATTWGGSDFAGGCGARRAPAILIVGSGHFSSFLCLLAYCVFTHRTPATPHDLLCAGLGGFVGSLGLMVFYRALAMGAMGLTAALTGLLTALLPVGYSMVREGVPPVITLAGLALGLGAIWLISHTPAGMGLSTPPRALLLGSLAGCCFGTQLILFKMAAGSGQVWTMTTARGAGSAAMLLVILLRPPKGPWKGFWGPGLLAGFLDTAGNFFYLSAAQLGRMDVAAVVSSLYPAGTILLAALVLKERPTRKQLMGMGLALGAVLLLSV